MFLHTYILFFFFFQAEDGIRDLTVTGVQTCALPISTMRRRMGRAVSASMTTSSPTAACKTYWSDVASTIAGTDRKSTRLNSSHSQISYAVFYLKKKKKKKNKTKHKKKKKLNIMTDHS